MKYHLERKISYSSVKTVEKIVFRSLQSVHDFAGLKKNFQEYSAEETLLKQVFAKN